MPILTKQYAEALCEVVMQKEDKEIEQILQRFVVLLKKHHRFGDLAKIIDYIKKYFENNKKSVLKLFLSYAGESPKEKILACFNEKGENREIILQEKKEESLIAGIKIYFEGTLIDGTIKGYLDNLKIKK